MDIGILGSGTVGQTVGAHLARHGHSVVLGTRRPEAREEERERAGSLEDWLREAEGNGRVGSYGEAAGSGEVVVNALPGTVALDVIEGLGDDALDGKILLDISNPLDFSAGFPPTLEHRGERSLAERIQEARPGARVVKALNTVTAGLMVAPASIGGGDHTLFVCGDDGAAKDQVVRWLRDWFDWRDVVDLGPLEAARGTEAYVLFWVRVMAALETPMFNVKVVR